MACKIGEIRREPKSVIDTVHMIVEKRSGITDDLEIGSHLGPLFLKVRTKRWLQFDLQ